MKKFLLPALLHTWRSACVLHPGDLHCQGRCSGEGKWKDRFIHHKNSHCLSQPPPHTPTCQNKEQTITKWGTADANWAKGRRGRAISLERLVLRARAAPSLRGKTAASLQLTVKVVQDATCRLLCPERVGRWLGPSVSIYFSTQLCRITWKTDYFLDSGWAGASVFVERSFRSFVIFAPENGVQDSFAGYLPTSHGSLFGTTDLGIYNQPFSFSLGFLLFGSKTSQCRMTVFNKCRN